MLHPSSYLEQRSFWSSSVFLKILMGLTGFIWLLFVMGHMLGNCLIFVGPSAYNWYAHQLTSTNFIYLAEAVLIVSLLVHIICALILSHRNQKAKPHKYAVSADGIKKMHPTSKYLLGQGALILSFIIIHLVNFKFGTYYETVQDGIIIRDLFRTVCETFQNPVAVVFYLSSVVTLGVHLHHGFGSSAQSLGIVTWRNRSGINMLGWLYAVTVTVGFLVQPIYVFLFY